MLDGRGVIVTTNEFRIQEGVSRELGVGLVLERGRLTDPEEKLAIFKVRAVRIRVYLIRTHVFVRV